MAGNAEQHHQVIRSKKESMKDSMKLTEREEKCDIIAANILNSQLSMLNSHPSFLNSLSLSFCLLGLVLLRRTTVHRRHLFSRCEQRGSVWDSEGEEGGGAVERRRR